MSRRTRAVLAALSFVLGVAGGAAGSGTVALAGQPQAGLADAAHRGRRDHPGPERRDDRRGRRRPGGRADPGHRSRRTISRSTRTAAPSSAEPSRPTTSRATPTRRSTRPSPARSWSSAEDSTSGPTRTAGTLPGERPVDRRERRARQVDQSNLQTADINQAIHQNLTGTFLVFGGTLRSTRAWPRASPALAACGVCSDALSDSSVGLVGGDLHQTRVRTSRQRVRTSSSETSTSRSARARRRPRPTTRPFRAASSSEMYRKRMCSTPASTSRSINPCRAPTSCLARSTSPPTSWR